MADRATVRRACAAAGRFKQLPDQPVVDRLTGGACDASQRMGDLDHRFGDGRSGNRSECGHEELSGPAGPIAGTRAQPPRRCLSSVATPISAAGRHSSRRPRHGQDNALRPRARRKRARANISARRPPASWSRKSTICSTARRKVDAGEALGAERRPARQVEQADGGNEPFRFPRQGRGASLAGTRRTTTSHQGVRALPAGVLGSSGCTHHSTGRSGGRRSGPWHR